MLNKLEREPSQPDKSVLKKKKIVSYFNGESLYAFLLRNKARTSALNISIQLYQRSSRSN